MAWTLLRRSPSLTTAERKVLSTNEIVNSLTEVSWEMFARWVQANDPNVPRAQQWLSDNGYGDDPSFLCTLLLMKLAGSSEAEPISKKDKEMSFV